jgi:hypothetical protein
MPEIEIRDVEIDLIKIDADIQPRERLDPDRVEILRERYQYQGPEKAFPPVIVYHDADGVFWLADGHYRLSAIREALSTDSPRVVRAEVREGSKRDAIFCAAGANGAHGTQLTKQEMRRVIERLLRDPAWGKMSARVIARHTGASNGYVSGIRKELKSQNASVYGTQIAPESSTVIVQRGEQEYPMKADNINRGRGSKPTTPESPVNLSVPQQDGYGLVADPQAIDTEDLDDLAKVWCAATYADRRDFIVWVLKRSVNDLGLDSLSESTKVISDVIVEMCRTPDPV